MPNRDLYTILTKKSRKHPIAAMTAGTKAETVTEVIEKTAIKQRNLIKEITLDTAGNTNLIAWKYFRNAIRVIDRFRINPKTCGVVKFMHTD